MPYERHVFRQLTPKEGETADQFMVRLRKQARHATERPSQGSVNREAKRF